jgi:N-acetylmuramoyl-L-alanine amidase
MIGIVIGHNRSAQGAVRVTDGVSEFTWNSELAELIRLGAPDEVMIFSRKPVGFYSREIDDVYRRVTAAGVSCSVELHFNSVASPRAEGCLTLSSGTEGSLALARAVHYRMLAVMENEDDGVQVRGPRARGGRSLHAGRPPAIMTEPYFGSNARSCGVAQAHMDELAEAIFEGAREFCAMQAQVAA